MIELRYISYKPERRALGNLMFMGKSFEATGGVFPKDHPFASGSQVFDEHFPSIGRGERLDALRKLGYYISCFPEGDGMCFKPPVGKSDIEVIEDICKMLQVTLTEIK